MISRFLADTSFRIGSGTGIFTRALLADPEWNKSIKKLVAVEPSGGMRKVFAESVHDDRVQVQEGTFLETGVEDGWADLVVTAQVCATRPHLWERRMAYPFDQGLPLVSGL